MLELNSAMSAPITPTTDTPPSAEPKHGLVGGLEAFAEMLLGEGEEEDEEEQEEEER